MAIEPPSTDRPLRLGAVSYLNSKPLVRGLDDALPEAVVTYDLPSRLADGLAAGELDVALVPIVEYLRRPDFQLVCDACVACRGPVLSVKLYFRVPPERVSTLAVDEGSRTSVALARVLLAKLHGVYPRLTRVSLTRSVDQVDADAVLLIGDRAMQPTEVDFAEVWDLGDRWCRWVELPFVFAAWIARPDVPTDMSKLSRTLSSVRDRGVAAIDTIVDQQAGPLGLAPETAREYLTRNLHFSLGAKELQGMRRFADDCRELGLVGSQLPTLRFTPTYNDCTTT